MPSEDMMRRTDRSVARFRFATRVFLVMNIVLLGAIGLVILFSH